MQYTFGTANPLLRNVDVILYYFPDFLKIFLNWNRQHIFCVFCEVVMMRIFFSVHKSMYN